MPSPIFGSATRWRAFIAIRMNSQVEEALAATVRELAPHGPAVRWHPPAKYHVTLKFLGAAIDPRRLEPLIEALRAIAADTPPFDVIAAGLGAFPSLDYPRVLWVGFQDAAQGALTTLASRVDDAALQCGFERERNGWTWTPHLTIARVDGTGIPARMREALAALKTREFGRSRIDSMTLYRSHPEAEGSRYESLASFPLQALR